MCRFTFALTRTHCPGLRATIVPSCSADPYNSIQPTPNAGIGPVPERRTNKARLRYENGWDSSGGCRSLKCGETGTSTGTNPVLRTRNSASKGSRVMSVGVTRSSAIPRARGSLKSGAASEPLPPTPPAPTHAVPGTHPGPCADGNRNVVRC